MEGAWSGLNSFSCWIYVCFWHALRLLERRIMNRKYQSFRQDCRFGMCISLNVRLFGHTFCRYRMFLRPIRKSVTSSRKEAIQSQALKSQVFDSELSFATNSSIIDDIATRQSRTRNSRQAVLAAEPVPHNIQDDFAPEPTFVRVQDALEFEAYYGFTREKAWELLRLNEYDPTIWYRKGNMLTKSSFLTTNNEVVRVKRACYVATTLFPVPGKQDAPDRLQAGAFLTSAATSPEIPLIFDTGASFSVSPCLEDFISQPEPLNGQVGLTDFKDDRTVAQGIGWIEWPVRDAFGRSSILRTQAYYVPNATVRLICPFQYRKEHKERDERAGTFESDGDVNLIWHDEFGNALHFVLSEAQRIPVLNLSDTVVETGFTNDMAYTLRTIQEDTNLQHLLYEMNHNLTKPQKELKLWHARLAHAGFAWIQDLMRSQKTNVGDVSEPPVIPTTNTTTASCAPPKCAACFFAKQHRRTPRTQTIVNKPEREMAIRRNAMKPGECVSGDQYMSSTRGRNRPLSESPNLFTSW